MPDNWALVRLRVVLALALLVLALSLLLLHELTNDDFEAASVSAESTAKDFYWIDIEPTHHLAWHSCYKPLHRECARLLVPLNHLNHSDENPGHAAIALIRKPSPFSSSSSKPHPRYRGPILFNPGGPGGSGVDLIVSIGDLLGQVVGDEFDIVSFDPRGVARSTPKAMFFDGAGRGERETWGMDFLDAIRDGPGDKDGDVKGENGRTLERTWARAVVKNGLAQERAGDWLGNVNTEQTAYDMLSIVRAFGRKKLMYWGFSYGTILGSTFAALFPDKVERVVLDGVVDTADYYATLWTSNLFDTPKTLNQFFTTCHDAGPSSCAFWAPSPSLISANLTRIYHDLITNPIPVRTSTSYGILDYSRVRFTVFLALYSPWASWPTVAQALADLGGPRRDPGLMWRLTEQPTFKCSCSTSCNDKNRREMEFETTLPDAQTTIVCSDGVDIPSDVASARSYFENFSKESEWADLWSNIRLGCSGWPKVKKGFQGPVEGNTSFPILFIGNTADPVTPLVHAKTMSKRFPGSRVLTQDSPGHASLNAPSVCTQSYVREYFLSGTLPPEGIVCPVISSPFPDMPLEGAQRDVKEGVVVGDRREKEMVFQSETRKAEEEMRMRDVVSELSKSWKPFNRAFL